MTYPEAVARLGCPVYYYSRPGNGKPPRTVLIADVVPGNKRTPNILVRDGDSTFLACLRQLAYLPDDCLPRTG